MYGKWVMDDMSSLTYIESSRPCSPQVEHISENQNPCLGGSFPQWRRESPYYHQLTPQSGSSFCQCLPSPTTRLNLRRRPDSNQDESTYRDWEAKSPFGLWSPPGSSWLPYQDSQQMIVADGANADRFTVTESEYIKEKTHFAKNQIPCLDLYAAMTAEVDDTYLTSDAGQQHLAEFDSLDSYTDLILHTTPTLDKRSGCDNESSCDGEISSYTSNFSPCLNQALIGLKWTIGFNTRLPLARLDQYLVALRQMVRRCCEATTITNDLRRTLTAEGALWVVKEAWPTAEGFWNMTTCMQGFFYAELWRNFPCKNSYNCLPPAYRPTRLQLTVPHSPIIDWLPWPDMRDLMIQYQHQIDIDAVCRYAILSMVAHRKKTAKHLALRFSQDQQGRKMNVGNVPAQEEAEAAANVHGNVSFRIWDLTLLESLNKGPPVLADSSSFRAKPQPRSLSMKALQRAYDLEYDDFSTMKIEDRFFERYPFLYRESLLSDFKVQALASVPYEDVGMPSNMTCDAVFRLKDKLQKIIGVRIEL